MLFSSITFLYFYLPLVLCIYFIAPKKIKNSVLLLASLVFYAWGEPKYVILMIISIVLGYVFGILIERFYQKPLSKIFLIMSVVTSLGMLGVFKYADFFITNINAATGLSIGLLKLALPIGISFYTFQILSYTVDVYRGDVKAQKNIITLGTYIALFPQLIAGPIVRYSDVEKQLNKRPQSFEYISAGTERFIIGLSKKVLIANQLGELCNVFKLSTDKSVMFFWLYAVAFALHIYFDFSGYSDMAIGLGRIFGFDFIENFNYPYISKSVTEFWRRWHMSLGSWFRDYVYIPLGGNRVGKIKWFRNILVVWFLTGFWHGAEWNFIVWGLMFAVLLLLEKVFLGKYIAKAKVWNHIYVLLMIIISFVIFNATDMKEALEYIGGMFGAGNLPLVSAEFFYYLRSYMVVLLLGIVGATPAPRLIWKRLASKDNVRCIINIIEIPVVCLLLILVTAFLVDGSFNPFLYFRF